MMIVSGNGEESRATRSTSRSAASSAATPATRSRATETMSSVTFASIFGVNARETTRRICACRGSSMLMREPYSSFISSGRSTSDTALWPEQNSSGWRLIATTSAWRVMAWKPGPGGCPGKTSGSTNRANGACSRSCAIASSLTSHGCAQKAWSDRSISASCIPLSRVLPQLRAPAQV